MKSAQDAAASSVGTGNVLPPRSVVRELLKSAQNAAASFKATGNTPPPRSAVREFLRSAKGAARTIVRDRNGFAPHSVLREFLRRRFYIAAQFAMLGALATVSSAQLNVSALAPAAPSVSVVTGKVIDDGGRPIPRATVLIEIRPVSKAPHPTPFSAWTKTAGNGQFQFPKVPSGHFSICVQSPGSGLLDPCFWDPSPPSLDVAGAPVSVPPISLRRGFALRVRLDDPKQQLAAIAAPNKPPLGVSVMLGVWKPGGGFVPLTLRYQDKYGQEFEGWCPMARRSAWCCRAASWRSATTAARPSTPRKGRPYQ
ncbi:MAG: carboxypeptidase-like regulatory domain-containing protein [Bryobacteraceae bacterium]